MDYTILEELTVSNIEGPTRCIDFLVGKFEACSTRNALKKAIKRKEILLNGNIANTGDWLKNGDKIALLETRGHIPKALDLKIPIIYEDDFLLVVNKPAGILTSGNQYDTLVNAMVGRGNLSQAPDAWDWFRPVHRLDRSTSGLVLLSKTAFVHRALVKLFEGRKIEKVYVAIVKGEIDNKGVIDEKVDGRDAVTEYNVLRRVDSVKNGVLSMVDLKPKTGRTHQLRIHCAGLGYPILGDKIHDNPEKTLSHKGLFLAAVRITFKHPVTGEIIDVSISAPKKFNALMEREQRWFDRINKS